MITKQKILIILFLILFSAFFIVDYEIVNINSSFYNISTFLKCVRDLFLIEFLLGALISVFLGRLFFISFVTILTLILINNENYNVFGLFNNILILIGTVISMYLFNVIITMIFTKIRTRLFNDI